MIKFFKGMFDFTNVKKGIITTCIGIVCIVYAGMQIVKFGLNGDAIELLIIGLLLLGVPDPRIPKNNSGTPPTAAVVILLCLLSSCVTWNKCAQKFGTGETHPITLRDTVKIYVPVPPDSLSGKVPCDELKQGDTVKQVSESGKVETTFWRDSANNLMHKTKCKNDTIYTEVPVEIKGDCPDAVVVDPDKALSWPEKLWKEFQFFSAMLVLAGLFIIVLWFIFKRFNKR